MDTSQPPFASEAWLYRDNASPNYLNELSNQLISDYQPNTTLQPSPADTASTDTLNNFATGETCTETTASSPESSIYTDTVTPKRKRGRPPLASKDVRIRLPHSAVEKTYRDGVSAAMQRLQKSIPKFNSPGSEDETADTVTDTRAPTKTVVLRAAVKYIRRLERERDELKSALETTQCKHET